MLAVGHEPPVVGLAATVPWRQNLTWRALAACRARLAAEAYEAAEDLATERFFQRPQSVTRENPLSVAVGAAIRSASDADARATPLTCDRGSAPQKSLFPA